MFRFQDRSPLWTALLASVLLHATLMLPALIRVDVRVASTAELPDTAMVLSAHLSLPPAGNDTTGMAQAPGKTAGAAAKANDATATAKAQLPFFRTNQLTQAPHPLHEVRLDLPEARLLTMPGTLRLTLWIDATGRVVAFQVDAPDLPEEYATAVAEHFTAVRFTPGEIKGRKVGSILELEISHETQP